MKYEPIQRNVAANSDTVADDLALIAVTIADAFREISSASRLESRWSRLRNCGDSF